MIKTNIKQKDLNNHLLNDYINEEMVLVESNDFLVVNMKYPSINMTHAIKECYMRKTVYEKLISASKLLPSGYKLVIWDAWRPFLLQKELYEKYSGLILDKMNANSYSKERQKKIINQFVAEPIEDVLTPPAHTTGGALDLTIQDENGNLLDMGTDFDEFSKKTNTLYFENSNNKIVKRNRRLLLSIMTKVGFSNLPSEWWHYDYGNSSWSFYKSRPVLYKGIFKIDS